MPDGPNQLDYAPAPPKWRSRWRKFVFRVLFVAVACVGVSHTYRLAYHFRFLYLQSRCMDFNAAPGTVLWDNGKVVSLAGTTEYERLGLQELVHQCIFLHGRKSVGRDRLVVVGLMDPSHGSRHLFGIALMPATLWGSSFVKLSRLPSHDAFTIFPEGRVRLFAGQPDPADDSHFTIEYELDGKRGVIDGWLMPDDTVKLEPRDGPLSRRGERE